MFFVTGVTSENDKFQQRTTRLLINIYY